MKHISLAILLFHVCVSFGQSKKTPDLVILSNVKSGTVTLRWAPANRTLWKLANANGYSVERIPFDHYMDGNDSAHFKNAHVLSVNIKPWSKDDIRWKNLLARNPKAAFAYGNLYSNEQGSSPQKMEMSFAMLMKACDLDKELSAAVGLIIRDTSVNDGESYVYRVTINKIPTSMKFVPAVVAANMKEPTKWPRMGTLKGKFGDRKVVLSFLTKDQKEFAGYWIERSEDSIHFSAVNKSPFIRATTKFDKDKEESTVGDSLPQNDKKYYYRIAAINCFGENAAVSNIISGKGKPDFKTYPLLDSTVIVKNSSVQLFFHMPPAFDKSQLHNYFVVRGEKRDGKYVVIAPKLGNTELTYTDAAPQDASYYKIGAVNKYGDTTYSHVSYAKLIDETPPQVPAQVSGKIDSNGVVTLVWAANTEKDLLGYRVFRCNSEKEQPAEITKEILSTTTFRDSVNLHTLTKKVFYTLRAVDKVHNNSDYSPYVSLVRPDKIPPVPIMFAKVTPSDSGIFLAWHNSSSSDVKKYSLFRKEVNGTWQVVTEWNAEDNRNSYHDASLTPVKTYQYKIAVSDESGNTSSTESHAVMYKPLFYPKLSLKSVADRSKRSIELQWNNADAQTYNFTLYKAKGKAPLQVFKMLPSSSGYFLDTELYPGNTYRYAIKATLKTGSETKLSDVITIEY